MDIAIQSQMLFGDSQSLFDFFLVHRLLHDQYAAAIVAKGGATPPLGGLSSTIAVEHWAAAMKPDGRGDSPVLLDWLRLHQNIHQAEYALLGFGQIPDLEDIDFSKEGQFYDWMFAHADIHLITSQALGVT